jgi:hypothetical protein
MQQNARLSKATRASLAAIGFVLATGASCHFVAAQDIFPGEEVPKPTNPGKVEYSPYPN